MNQSNAKTRAYVLLRAPANHRRQAMRSLKQQEGVVAVDLVEGPPDIVLVIEAPDRRELASVLVKAMSSVESVTYGMELLPTCSGGRGKSSFQA